MLGPVECGGGACFWVVVWELLDVVVVVVLVVVVLGGVDAVVGGGVAVDDVLDDVVGGWQVTPGTWMPGRFRHEGRAPEAVGIAARPITSAAALAAATGILSFLRLNTVV